jgi:hypothetical protein
MMSEQYESLHVQDFWNIKEGLEDLYGDKCLDIVHILLCCYFC